MAMKQADVNWLTKPEAVDDLPPIITAKAMGFAVIAPQLKANPQKWFKIAEGNANGNDARLLSNEWTEFEFAVRLNPDAIVKDPRSEQHVRNKDIYARYMGLEWYLERVKEKQRRRREREQAGKPPVGRPANLQPSTATRPTPVVIPPHRNPAEVN